MKTNQNHQPTKIHKLWNPSLGFHTSEQCVQLSLVTFDSDLPTCACGLPRPTCLLSWPSLAAAAWQSSPISAWSWPDEWMGRWEGEDIPVPKR